MESKLRRALLNFAIPSEGENVTVVTDGAGIELGTFEFWICNTPREASVNWDVYGGPETYLGSIPEAVSEPFAWLEYIEAHVRNKGNGTMILEAFYEAARAKGVKLALLRLGWFDESKGEKNRYFYKSRGWEYLPTSEELKDTPIAYRRL
jgi:GNAT superfamily N-acetyltransferase